MKSTKYIFSVLVIAGLTLIGCDKSTEATTDNSILLEDAAESISAAMGDASGGATETFADVTIASGGGSMETAAPVMDGADRVNAGTPVYDSLTGWWFVSVNRSRGNGMMQRTITREYRYQYQKNNEVRKEYITNGDTATTLKFQIVSGTGTFSGPRMTHALTTLKGAWTSSNIHKDTVTITLDSNYVRAGTDTIRTRQLTRTHTGTMTITAMNVRTLNYRPSLSSSWRTNFSNSISGTLSGRYTATITFEKGELYKERSVDREFTITVGGGTGSLNLGGNNGRFSIDMLNGQRKP
ncbi:MAG: hypothetical protein WCX28_06980 [Bacteriovoracaceae bacterium]|nr:hypothetical protein [Bacteroidota bacterium]